MKTNNLHGLVAALVAIVSAAGIACAEAPMPSNDLRGDDDDSSSSRNRDKDEDEDEDKGSSTSTPAPAPTTQSAPAPSADAGSSEPPKGSSTSSSSSSSSSGGASVNWCAELNTCCGTLSGFEKLACLGVAIAGDKTACQASLLACESGVFGSSSSGSSSGGK